MQGVGRVVQLAHPFAPMQQNVPEGHWLQVLHDDASSGPSVVCCSASQLAKAGVEAGAGVTWLGAGAATGPEAAQSGTGLRTARRNRAASAIFIFFSFRLKMLSLL
jgi:hypothetical protein